MAEVTEVMGWGNFTWVSSGSELGAVSSSIRVCSVGEEPSLPRDFMRAVMTIKFDAGKMHRWVTFIVRPLCQELLESVV